MQEIWKDIKEYEGLYQVSNLGNIRRIGNYKNQYSEWKSFKNLKLSNRKGYLYTVLCKNGISTHFLVHRLVAKTFIDNRNNLNEVNHKDGNKQNNNVNNLEWCSHSENIIYAYKNGLHKTNYIHGNTPSRPVNQYDLNGNFIKKWESVSEAQKALNISHISECCRDIRKKTHNFIWRYDD